MTGQSKRKLLVLDDDAGVVDFLCESLSERGFEVTGLTSPREALLRIKTDSFDLVITDVEMPQMRGTELLAAILGEKPSQLVLLITAFGSIDLAVSTVQWEPATSSPSLSRLRLWYPPSSAPSTIARSAEKSFG
jgi:DNA-binding NtrC family response regulator